MRAARPLEQRPLAREDQAERETGERREQPVEVARLAGVQQHDDAAGEAEQTDPASPERPGERARREQRAEDRGGQARGGSAGRVWSRTPG